LKAADLALKTGARAESLRAEEPRRRVEAIVNVKGRIGGDSEEGRKKIET
jgi:hypothetical protein